MKKAVWFGHVNKLGMGTELRPVIPYFIVHRSFSCRGREGLIG